MRLPASGRANEADGARVFDGSGSDNLVLVQPVADGARAMIQISGSDAPSTYRFPIAGATRLALESDGSVDVYDGSSEDVDVPAATIAPAWAKDANGNDVPTSYTIDGTTLVQCVGFDDATAFPVSADPTFSGSCGWFTCTVRLNRAATRNARDASWIIAATAGACGAVTAGTASIICAAAIGAGGSRCGRRRRPLLRRRTLPGDQLRTSPVALRSLAVVGQARRSQLQVS